MSCAEHHVLASMPVAVQPLNQPICKVNSLSFAPTKLNQPTTKLNSLSCAEHHVMSPPKAWKSPISPKFFSDLLAKKHPFKQACAGVRTTEQFMPWWNDEFLNLQYSFDIFPKWCVFGWVCIWVWLCVFVCVYMYIYVCVCVRAHSARPRPRACVIYAFM